MASTKLTRVKAKRRLEVFKSKVFLALNRATFGESCDMDIVVNSRKLLKYGTWGSNMYDLLLMLTPCVKNCKSWGVEKYYEITKKYISEVSLSEHITGCKKIIYDGTSSSGLNTILLLTMAYLNSFYTDAEILGVSANGEVIKSTYNYLSENSDPITMYDLVCWAMLTKDIFVRDAVDDNIIHVSFSETVKSNIVEAYRMFYSPNREAVMSSFIEDMTYPAILPWFATQYPILMASSLWVDQPLELSGPGTKFRWEREDFHNGKTKEENLVIFGILNNLPSNVLMHRNFYVRDQGVIIKFEIPVDPQIEFIHMREVHDDFYDFILISYKVGEAIRTIPLFIENINSSLLFLLYELDLVVICLAITILGISDWVISNIEELKAPSELSDGFSQNEYREEFNKVLVKWVGVVKEHKPYYEAPLGWNYETKTSQVLSSGKMEYLGSKIINVGRYTRKLPEGFQASEEAKMTAAKYKIILKPGYTFVEEFEKEIPIKSAY